MLSSRIEIFSWDCNDRYERLVNDKRQVSRVEWKIFTRFAFKLVFGVSGRSVPWDNSSMGAFHIFVQCITYLRGNFE